MCNVILAKILNQRKAIAKKTIIHILFIAFFTFLLRSYAIKLMIKQLNIIIAVIFIRYIRKILYT